MSNRIKFKDFVPKVVESSFWKGKSYESIDKVMEEVNEWLRRNYNIELINIETINSFVGYRQKHNQSASRLYASGHVDSLQIIRVWYK